MAGPPGRYSETPVLYRTRPIARRQVNAWFFRHNRPRCSEQGANTDQWTIWKRGQCFQWPRIPRRQRRRQRDAGRSRTRVQQCPGTALRIGSNIPRRRRLPCNKQQQLRRLFGCDQGLQAEIRFYNLGSTGSLSSARTPKTHS